MLQVLGISRKEAECAVRLSLEDGPQMKNRLCSGNDDGYARPSVYYLSITTQKNRRVVSFGMKRGHSLWRMSLLKHSSEKLLTYPLITLKS